jgi:hypothetical protein
MAQVLEARSRAAHAEPRKRRLDKSQRYHRKGEDYRATHMDRYFNLEELFTVGIGISRVLEI